MQTGSRHQPTGDNRLAVLIGNSEPIVAVRQMIDQLAGAETAVLVIGPPGSGKSVVARLLHERGTRAARPFVMFDCAAVPGERLEAGLFGCSTKDVGGTDGYDGCLAAAAGGTLFLRCVETLPAELQAKLFRVLTTRQIERGEGTYVAVDVRVVVAATIDLGATVAAGRFLDDLLAPLAPIEIVLPPLADRRGDIPLLIEHFAGLEAGSGPRPVFSTPALLYLARQSWPGNVRDLERFVAKAVMARRREIDEPKAAVLLHGERRKVDRWLTSAVAPLPMPNRRRPLPIVAANEVLDLTALLSDFEQARICETLQGIPIGVAAATHLFGLYDDAT